MWHWITGGDTVYSEIWDLSKSSADVVVVVHRELNSGRCVNVGFARFSPGSVLIYCSAEVLWLARTKWNLA